MHRKSFLYSNTRSVYRTSIVDSICLKLKKQNRMVGLPHHENLQLPVKDRERRLVPVSTVAHKLYSTVQVYN